MAPDKPRVDDAERLVNRIAEIVECVGHPTRLRIMAWGYARPDEPIVPVRLAAELGIRVENLAYHVRKLRDLRLLREVRKVPRRGALEHHYVLTAKGRRLVEWAARVIEDGDDE